MGGAVKKVSRLQAITVVEALTLLEKLLRSHAYLIDDEGVKIRCECSLCQEIWAMFDGKDS